MIEPFINFADADSPKITEEYFLSQCAEFREMLGNAQYSYDDLFAAFGSLIWQWMNTKKSELTERMFESIKYSWELRAPYILFAKSFSNNPTRRDE